MSEFFTAAGFVHTTGYVRFSVPFVFSELVRVVGVNPIVFLSHRIK
jgi:hypothetical protein